MQAVLHNGKMVIGDGTPPSVIEQVERRANEAAKVPVVSRSTATVKRMSVVMTGHH